MTTNAPRKSNSDIHKIVGEMISKPSISLEFPNEMHKSITALIVGITEANSENEIKTLLDGFYRKKVFDNDYFESDKQIKEVSSIIFSSLKKFETDSNVRNLKSTQVARTIQGITKKRNDELNSPILPSVPKRPIEQPQNPPASASASAEFVEVDLGPPLAQASSSAPAIANSDVKELNRKLDTIIYELAELARKTESYLTRNRTFGREPLTKTSKEITLIQDKLQVGIRQLESYQDQIRKPPVTIELVQSIKHNIEKIKKDTDKATKTISKVESKETTAIRARQPKSEKSLSSMFEAVSKSLSNFLKFLSNLVPNFRARAVAPNYQETQHAARHENEQPRNTSRESRPRKGPGR